MDHVFASLFSKNNVELAVAFWLFNESVASP
jgi:hypothetical protein